MDKKKQQIEIKPSTLIKPNMNTNFKEMIRKQKENCLKKSQNFMKTRKLKINTINLEGGKRLEAELTWWGKETTFKPKVLWEFNKADTVLEPFIFEEAEDDT